MAKVDCRIHFALSACAAALENGPKLPPAARALITGAMELLLDADKHIKRKMKDGGMK